MATGSSGGGGGSGGSSGGHGSGSGPASSSGTTAGAAQTARAAGEGAPIKAGDVEVLSADGKSQGVFSDGRPAAPNVRLEPLDRNSSAGTSGVRLDSLGKGSSTADVDVKTNEVLIRRSGRVVERFEDDRAILDFAQKKRLSDLDRETLLKLDALKSMDPQARADARRAIDARSPAPEVELTNAVAADTAQGRIRAEVERNDADVYARVEAMKKAREAAKAKRIEPLEPVPAPIAAARAGQEAEARSDDTITRESPFSSPNSKIRIVPADITAQFIKAGDKYYVPNNTKVVAFVDRGDKLETSSSAPQIAKSLVAIAEARGWDELRVKGTDGFRREVWLEASSRGIHVDGYKPSEVDKAELERRNAFTRDHNSIERRSDVFKRSTPEEGVRQDPTLAGAYGAVRQAELVAAKHIHPESRPGFVQSVRDKVGRKLDADRPVDVKLKVPEGKLVEHGAAHYNFDANEKPSYYVRLRDARGREHVQWGAGLRAAMQAAEAQPGDTIQLRVTESKGVVVEGNVRDNEGRIVGRKTVDAHRNEWQAVVTARERAAERQVEQQRVR